MAAQQQQLQQQAYLSALQKISARVPQINLELGEFIASGSFGVVHHAQCVEFGKTAVKLIPISLIAEERLTNYVLHEVSLCKKLRHPHIVRTFDATIVNYERCLRAGVRPAPPIRVAEDGIGRKVQGECLAIIMETAPGGDLLEKLLRAKRLDQNTARRYFQQMVSALICVHSLDYCHRDIKGENLLLGAQGEIKLCDFGMAKNVVDHREQQSTNSFDPSAIPALLLVTNAGSLDYQAPEVLREGGYFGFSCDVWSAGVVLYTMLVGQFPFAPPVWVQDGAARDAATEKLILAGKFDHRAVLIPPQASDLLVKMLQVDVQVRCTFYDVVMDPWFQQGLLRATIEDLEKRARRVYVERRFYASPSSSPASSSLALQLQQQSASSSTVFETLSSNTSFSNSYNNNNGVQQQQLPHHTSPNNVSLLALASPRSSSGSPISPPQVVAASSAITAVATATANNTDIKNAEFSIADDDEKDENEECEEEEREDEEEEQDEMEKTNALQQTQTPVTVAPSPNRRSSSSSHRCQQGAANEDDLVDRVAAVQKQKKLDEELQQQQEQPTKSERHQPDMYDQTDTEDEQQQQQHQPAEQVASDAVATQGNGEGDDDDDDVEELSDDAVDAKNTLQSAKAAPEELGSDRPGSPSFDLERGDDDDDDDDDNAAAQGSTHHRRPAVSLSVHGTQPTAVGREAASAPFAFPTQNNNADDEQQQQQEEQQQVALQSQQQPAPLLDQQESTPAVADAAAASAPVVVNAAEEELDDECSPLQRTDTAQHQHEQPQQQQQEEPKQQQQQKMNAEPPSSDVSELSTPGGESPPPERAAETTPTSSTFAVAHVVAAAAAAAEVEGADESLHFSPEHDDAGLKTPLADDGDDASSLHFSPEHDQQQQYQQQQQEHEQQQQEHTATSSLKKDQQSQGQNEQSADSSTTASRSEPQGVDDDVKETEQQQQQAILFLRKSTAAALLLQSIGRAFSTRRRIAVTQQLFATESRNRVIVLSEEPAARCAICLRFVESLESIARVASFTLLEHEHCSLHLFLPQMSALLRLQHEQTVLAPCATELNNKFPYLRSGWPLQCEELRLRRDIEFQRELFVCIERAEESARFVGFERGASLSLAKEQAHAQEWLRAATTMEQGWRDESFERSTFENVQAMYLDQIWGSFVAAEIRLCGHKWQHVRSSCLATEYYFGLHAILSEHYIDNVTNQKLTEYVVLTLEPQLRKEIVTQEAFAWESEIAAPTRRVVMRFFTQMFMHGEDHELAAAAAAEEKFVATRENTFESLDDAPHIIASGHGGGHNDDDEELDDDYANNSDDRNDNGSRSEAAKEPRQQLSPQKKSQPSSFAVSLVGPSVSLVGSGTGGDGNGTTTATIATTTTAIAAKAATSMMAKSHHGGSSSASVFGNMTDPQRMAIEWQEILERAELIIEGSRRDKIERRYHSENQSLVALCGLGKQQMLEVAQRVAVKELARENGIKLFAQWSLHHCNMMRGTLFYFNYPPKPKSTTTTTTIAPRRASMQSLGETALPGTAVSTRLKGGAAAAAGGGAAAVAALTTTTTATTTSAAMPLSPVLDIPRHHHHSFMRGLLDIVEKQETSQRVILATSATTTVAFRALVLEHEERKEREAFRALSEVGYVSLFLLLKRMSMRDALWDRHLAQLAQFREERILEHDLYILFCSLRLLQSAGRAFCTRAVLGRQATRLSCATKLLQRIGRGLISRSRLVVQAEHEKQRERLGVQEWRSRDVGRSTESAERQRLEYFITYTLSVYWHMQGSRSRSQSFISIRKNNNQRSVRENKASPSCSMLLSQQQQQQQQQKSADSGQKSAKSGGGSFTDHADAREMKSMNEFSSSAAFGAHHFMSDDSVFSESVCLTSARDYNGWQSQSQFVPQPPSKNGAASVSAPAAARPHSATSFTNNRIAPGGVASSTSSFSYPADSLAQQPTRVFAPASLRPASASFVSNHSIKNAQSFSLLDDERSQLFGQRPQQQQQQQKQTHREEPRRRHDASEEEDSEKIEAVATTCRNAPEQQQQQQQCHQRPSSPAPPSAAAARAAPPPDAPAFSREAAAAAAAAAATATNTATAVPRYALSRQPQQPRNRFANRHELAAQQAKGEAQAAAERKHRAANEQVLAEKRLREEQDYLLRQQRRGGEHQPPHTRTAAAAAAAPAPLTPSPLPPNAAIFPLRLRVSSMTASPEWRSASMYPSSKALPPWMK